MQACLKPVVAVATVAYPIVVYLGLGRWDPFWIALPLALLLALRAWDGRDAVWLIAAAGALVLGALASAQGSWLPLKLYPLLVNAVLLTVFAASLWRPPTIVERIARLREPQLPPHAVAYTRKVTLAWCAFFLVNGLVSAATAVWGSDQVWLLYNGLLAYLLIGAFFGLEWTLRQRMRNRGAEAGHG